MKVKYACVAGAWLFLFSAVRAGEPSQGLSAACLRVQPLTLDPPTVPRPAGTNPIVALKIDQENVPMLAEPPASRYGPKNVWRLLYSEGDLETIRDPSSRAGADAYNSDLYRFKFLGKDCSIGTRLAAEFSESNSAGCRPHSHAGLFIRIYTK